MDPQKKIWKGESGHKYKLTKNISGNDSFAPFRLPDSCSLDFFQTSYPGTMIRLALRNKPSLLSSTLYDIEKLKLILNALKDDAKILLLFLRYIEKVEVSVINNRNKVSKIFSMKIDKAAETIRSSKKDFFIQVKDHYANPCTSKPLPQLQYEVTIVIEDFELNLFKASQWVIVHRIGSEEPSFLNASKKGCSLPWVGVAIPLSSQSLRRLFCFLPMPDSEEVNPPLPVCVHGTFGLTKDRRHLKWKTSDMQNDDGAIWNKLLLSSILPYCYASCLKLLKSKCDINDFYQFWPKVSLVKETSWRIILKPLLSLLLEDQLFWSKNGSWVKLQSSVCVAPQMNSGQFPQAVVNALIGCGVTVAVLADCVWEAVKFIYTYSKYPFTIITPSLVRKTLKNNSGSYTNMNRTEMFELLNYCIEDKGYRDLSGLALLPLYNNTFITFEDSYFAKPVYICDKDFLETRLLANNETLVNVEAEDKSLHNKLIEIANGSYTQLKCLTAKAVAVILKQLSPFHDGWCCYGAAGGFYNENWLKAFWKWVNASHLSYFIGIPLLPTSYSNGKSFKGKGFGVVALQNVSTSRVIKCDKTACLDFQLIKAAVKLGCFLINFQDFKFLNNINLNEYVHEFTPSSLLSISSQMRHQNFTFTQEEAKALRHFLFQYPLVNLSKQQTVVLLNLSIFPSIQSNILHSLHSAYSTTARKSGAMMVIESNCLDKYKFWIPPSPILLTSCDKSIRITESLKYTLPQYIWFPTKLDVLLHVILPKKQLIRENVDTVKLFSIILEPKEYHSLLKEPDNKMLVDYLRSAKCLPTCNTFNNLFSPCEVYDPRDLTVKGLFEGQNVFPVAPFVEEHFGVLRKLGMKNTDNLDMSDVLTVIQFINSLSNAKAKITKSHKLIEFLSSSKGDTLLNSHLAVNKSLTSMPWLPVMVTPPKDYPKFLDWEGATGSQFISSLHVHASSSQDLHKSLPFLIGSQVKILQYEGLLSPKLLALLQIPENVPVDAMIHHLLSLLSYQHKVDKRQLKDFIELLYKHLQSAVMKTCDSEDWHCLNQSEVVQVSEGKFVQPSLVAFSFDDKSMTVGKLEPYLYILPSHLQQYRRLFQYIGVKEQVCVDDVLGVLNNIASNQNKDDQKLTIDILKWICNNFSDTELQHYHERILVPVDNNDMKNKLVLKPANQVAYLDKDLHWLKRDKVALSNIMEKYFLVNPIITTDMACTLQLKPLNKMVAYNEEICFEQAGQSEPLTTRLNRILKDYKDTSVLQELLQNADDAGATEVAVYYDTRNHDKSNLFFPGMANSYGPALLFYNDVEFSQDDFKNITKISGETKGDKLIGKFGVGFCSVYHITDVPSFLSGEFFFIFDPTLQCLHNEIESKLNPGIKINFIKHRFIKTSNQFIPYHTVRGFDPKKPFKGTLFRFPLRYKSSQISKNICTEDKLLYIIDEMKQNSPKLLMFLNNVKKISFHRSHGSGFKNVFTVTSRKAHISEINGSSLTEYKVFKPKCSERKEENWIIATNCQQWETSNHYMQYGTASVSVKLKHDAKIQMYCIDPVEGECFCYLPLHIKTGLPVHVSSNFAVMTNRRALWKADNLSSATGESDWNKMLMQTVVLQAYIALLLYLKQRQTNQTLTNYSYHCLWPVHLREMVPWDILLNRFYDSILSSSYPLFCSKVGGWKYLNESKFLSSDILSASFQKDLRFALEKVASILKLPVVDLPDDIWNRFGDDDDRFNVQIINEKQFLQLFYDHKTLSKVSNKYKNIIITASLITFANDKHIEILPGLMKNTKCIPCCPDGIKYRKPEDIVDPKSQISKLFISNENRCPENTFFMQSDLLHQSLVGLGMMQSLPWELVIDRAKKMQYLFKENFLKGFDYLNTLLECIKENLRQEVPPAVKNELQKIAFLPVMKKPPDYLMDWKGDSDLLLLCGPKLTKVTEGNDTINAIYACGSQVAILDSNEITSRVLTNEVLNVIGVKKQLQNSNVISHFNMLLLWFQKFSAKKLDKNILQFTSKVTTEVYRYWGKCFESKNLSLESLSLFTDEACVWNGVTFLHPSTVSFNWPTNGPYLYKLPDTIPYSVQPIMKHLGVQDEFSVEILVNALCQMKQYYKESCLAPECQDVVSLILPKIANKIPDDAEIYLPDSNFVLKKAKELKYNDAPWSALQKKYTFCHNTIGRDIALGLKVEPVRSAILKRFENNPNVNPFSVEFGPEETLIGRLQNILEDYPKDCTFIKEILQNADDAGATQLYVILDKRRHDKDSEKVISEKWKMLQGPALLFWNDSIFTEKDFTGIQKLGQGSKKDDADKIGLYGIGFNVVYHFTDCPSFVTDNKLCIIDPLYHFIALEGGKPGMMYNDFFKLCKEFPGMKSQYLLNDKGKIPSEIKMKGSLFRLPLRLTTEMINLSKFSSGTLSLEKLEMELSEWVSQVSEALLFMKHINDVKYFIIDDTYWSKSSLQIHLSTFKEGEETIYQRGKSKLILYPITLCKGKKKSKWFVQLGEGNIEDADYDWDQVKPLNVTVKPHHGIAVPILVYDFEGKSFCFLPLPDGTNLPIHIHGNFILRSDRRDIWISNSMKNSNKGYKSDSSATCTVDTDMKTKWNQLLLNAIGVSYAYFLISYKDKISASQLHKFYKLFPKLKACSRKHWLALAKHLYSTLIYLNAPILAKLVYHGHEDCSEINVLTDKQLKSSVIKWYALCNPDSPDECFFHSASSDIKNVLTSIGMNLIDTPIKIREQVKEVNDDLQLLEVSRESVLKYYVQFCNLIYDNNTLPCSLSLTKFKNIECFAVFLNYVMQKGGKFLDEESDLEKDDSKEILTLGLLVTADEYLHCLSDGNKILSSTYWNIFPNSHQSFIHEALQEMYPFDSDYLLYKCSGRDGQLECVLSVIAKNIPSSWNKTTEASYTTKNAEKIKLLFECLSNDTVFHEHCNKILMEFPLLPANNNVVYSGASKVLPLESLRIFNENVNYSISDVKKLMNKLKVPLLRHELLGSLLQMINIQIPNISYPENILKTLYLMKDLNSHIYQELCESDLMLLFEILQQLSYSSVSNQDYIKHLPIFTTINGELVSLVSASYVWIWDDNEVCTAGINKLIKCTSSDAIFLNSSAPWASLQHEAKNLEIQNISTCKYDVYCKFIFPNFHLLDSSAQMDHLIFIREEIYPACKLILSRKRSTDIDKVNSFVNDFKSLRCIPDTKGNFQTIDFFYNHDDAVFKVFCSENNFLPIELRTKEWTEFLEYFGLKIAPTQQQFVSYCKQLLMFDNFCTIKKASMALLDVLFYQPPLRSDNKYEDIHTYQCLQKVSQIPIVIVENAPELNSIAKQKLGEHVIRYHYDITLTKLAGSSLNENKYLVWTIVPLIELQCYKSISPVHNNKLNNLGVLLSPTVDDVALNLKNLSTTIFANSLRSQKCNTDFSKSKLLPKIVIAMLAHMQQKLMSDDCTSPVEGYDQLERYDLSNTEIIPVKISVNDTEEYILMKPVQVLSMNPSDVAPYHPFIYPLIEEAYSVLTLLLKIGVQRSLNFSHIQYILKSAKDKFLENEVDLSTKKTIIEATQHLVGLLEQHKSEDDVILHLKPLYLLTEKNVLTECHRLVVHDIAATSNLQLPSGYAFLHPLEGSHTLLQYLPKEFGLSSLKSILSYKIVNNSSAEHLYPCASTLGEIIKSKIFKEALLLFSSYCTQNTISPCLSDILVNFQTNLIIECYNDLRAIPQVTLGNELIQLSTTIDCCFFLEKLNDHQWILRLKNTEDAYSLPDFMKLAKQLCSYLQLKSTGCFEISNDNGLPEVTTFVCSILQCASVSSIVNVIEAYIPGVTHNNTHLAVANVNSDPICEGYDGQLLDLLLPTGAIGLDNKNNKAIVKNALTEYLKKLSHDNPEPQVDLNEAKVWIKQAKHDYSALSALLLVSKSEKTHYAAVCFMCHQVAEKSLKAGMYAKYGLNPIHLWNHDLIPLANRLNQLGCSVNKMDVKFLSPLYVPTRYPNRWKPSAVPEEKYSSDTAQQAFDTATRILQEMEKVIDDMVN